MEEVKELHRGVFKKFVKRKIITKGIDNLSTADPLILDTLHRIQKILSFRMTKVIILKILL